MTKEEAMSLVREKVKSENLRKHLIAVSAIMGKLAERLGENRELWEIVGLLHDVEYERYPDERHGELAAKLLEEKGLPREAVDAVRKHVTGENLQTKLDYALYTADPASGFIIACALVRPDKRIETLTVRSAKKKFKDKRFAAGASRKQMRLCEKLGLSLEEFLELSIEALKGAAEELGL